MMEFRSVGFLGIAGSLAMMTACSAGGSQLAPVSAKAFAGSAARRPAHGASWMRPEAKSHALLYVSEGTGAVNVYAYPTLQLMGTLTGFASPQGECVDASGDVWITDQDASTVVEYAHGGAVPIRTLKDTGNEPVDCSVDPKSGDLAVVSLHTENRRHGRLSIYAGARGTKKTYQDATMQEMDSVGYDNHGNAFVDGIAHGVFAYAKFSNGVFTDLTLGENFSSPGGIRFDGTYMAVGDAEGQVIYQTSGSTIVGSTALEGSGAIQHFSITGARVICADFAHLAIEIYSYPAGGSPIEVFSDDDDPIGVALSRL
ncbi:MAG: hypothetical protein WB615_14165 [Candidatus Tumulicola sp.]